MVSWVFWVNKAKKKEKKKKGNLIYKGIGCCIKGEREAEIAPKRRAGQEK